jgi:hypothetical protein
MDNEHTCGFCEGLVYKDAPFTPEGIYPIFERVMSKKRSNDGSYQLIGRCKAFMEWSVRNDRELLNSDPDSAISKARQMWRERNP